MGEVKNHIRNVKAEELMCMSHGHERSGEGRLEGVRVQVRGG